MYNFDRLEKSKINLKHCLENCYQRVYIEKVDIQEKEINKKIDNSIYLISFKNNALVDKLSSVEDIKSIKNSYLEIYENFIHKYIDYFKRVENQLDDKNKHSLTIIYKTLQNRNKKFKSTLNKFEIEDNWKISDIKERLFDEVIAPFLKDILSNLLISISNGMKENTLYRDILNLLNRYLEEIGVYTKEIKEGEECDYDLLEPEECDNCETDDKSKKDIIKEVISYPYLSKFENNEYIVMSGKIYVWKVVTNANK